MQGRFSAVMPMPVSRTTITTLSGWRPRRDADHHLALLGELDRIAQQIEHHLAQTLGVSMAPGGQVRVDDAGHVQALEAGADGGGGQGAFDTIDEVEVGGAQFEGAGFDA